MVAVAKSARSPHLELLVKDRLAEFRQLAQAKGTLLGDEAPGVHKRVSGKDAGAPAAAAVGKSNFMRDFFEAISGVQNSLNKGRENVKLMGEVLEDALQATTQAKERAVSDRLNELVQDTNVHVRNSMHGLEALKARTEGDEGKRCSPGEAKIQANMQQAMAKKHQQLLVDFQQAQQEFKRTLERRQEREMQILMPDATEAERAGMIECGETTSLMVAKKMAGAHAMLLDEVQRIRDKHQDILKLEQNIADLASMFQEMAVLVDAQGEMLDAIEVHVHKTKDCTAKAEKNLITTRKVQRKTQKQMCCLTIVVLIIAMSIIFPILKS
eukprot:TRINITY_DN14395_c0_g3_i1.p2 TRINITY_DN14395_c0_g3~~TRINITY_DN14395_c0_g3_i1.p2  ORF type:complete len:351 (-),score=102.71 TRINITY_DN14395_c0_g3_i1:72-1049(-)